MPNRFFTCLKFRPARFRSASAPSTVESLDKLAVCHQSVLDPSKITTHHGRRRKCPPLIAPPPLSPRRHHYYRANACLIAPLSRQRLVVASSPLSPRQCLSSRAGFSLVVPVPLSLRRGLTCGASPAPAGCRFTNYLNVPPSLLSPSTGFDPSWITFLRYCNLLKIH